MCQGRGDWDGGEKGGDGDDEGMIFYFYFFIFIFLLHPA